MSKKILLVEDEAILAMAEAGTLKKYKYQVATSHSGEKAVEAVNSDPNISLILMDIDLGRGMDGTETAQEILKNHDIPIVFLTSHSEKEYVDRVKEITRYGYVLKNSGEFVLIESINMAFELFEANQHRKQHEQQLENTVEELKTTNENLLKKEEDLQKNNRALRTLSECNQALVRDNSEAELVQEICNVIVEKAGYKLCWLGYIEGEGEERTVVPNACSGFGKDYVENLAVQFDNDPSSNGPTAMAIRMKEPCVVNRIMDDPNYKQWREASLKYGFKSSIALPLINNNEVFAVLNIYASEIEVFMEEEKELLIELSKDLSYGIRNIRTEQEKERKEELLENIIENVPVGLQIFDGDGYSYRMNKRQKELLGLSSEQDGIGKFNVLTDPYSIEHGANELYRQVYNGESFIDMENEYNFDIPVNEWETRKEKRFFNESIFPIFNIDNEVEYVVSLLLDITDRKNAVEDLRRSEESLKKTQEIAHIGSWVLDLSSSQLTWSDEIYRIFGLKPQEFGATYEAFLEAVHPEDREMVDKAYTNSIHQQKDGYEIEHRIVRTNTGELRYVYEKCVHLKNKSGTIIRSMGMVQDITERRKSEEAYQRIFNLTPALICVAGTDGYFKELNPEWEKTLGYSIEELKSSPIIDFIHPDDVDTTLKEIEKQVSGGKTARFVNRYRQKDGTYRFLEWNAAPSEQGNLYASARDITEQILSETRLQESEQKYKSLFHQSPVSITIHDKITGEVVDANRVAYNVYGLNSITEFQKNDFWMEPPYSFQEALEWIHKAANEGVQQFEWKNRNKQGDAFWEYVTLRLVTINNEERVLSTAIDISNQKKAEAALREKTEILNYVINNISDIVVLADINGCITFHTNIYDILGYNQDSLIGRNVLEFVHPEDLPEIESTLMNFLSSKEDRRRVEYRFRSADDSYIWVETDGKTIKDEKGDIEKLLFSTRDITERQHIEEELQESEERYKTIFNNSEVSLWEEDFTEVRTKIEELKQKGVEDFNEYFDSHPAVVWKLASEIKVLNINDATLRFYGATSKQEMLGSLDKTLYLTDDTYRILKEELIAISDGTSRVQGETKTKTLNGTVLNILMNVYISNEKDIMIVAISDITPYKKALAEKESLMKELNHRVKNNLAMVSSLISLKESEVSRDLSDLKHRVEVIKLVHEKLHHQNDIEQIALREYFQDILEAVFSATFKQPVEIVNDIEQVNVSSKLAITLGLIVNEIATNAMKYGFSSVQKSRFIIKMMRDPQDQQHILTLSNTGNPFPESVDLENPETMGLQLVANLVRQLDGTIELQKKPYPIFTIRFPSGEE